jgi:NAD-dependent deacetylase
MRRLGGSRVSGVKIVVLTGAGISAESGVPTFRDADGLWEGHRVEEVATPEAYDMAPTTVHRFYDARRSALLMVQPNAAHHALARLEEALGDDLLVVTQNIDDLHERAGSRRVMHMHGELLSALCRSCDGRVRWEVDLVDLPPCPWCGSARSRTAWSGSRSSWRAPTCSSPSAPPARSTPRPDSSSRR